MSPKNDKRHREYLVRQQKYAMDRAAKAMDHGDSKRAGEAVAHVEKCGHAMGIGLPEKRGKIKRTFT